MTSEDVQRVRVGAVELAATTTGDPADPPVLLVAGLGAQLISWDDGFCRALADRGLYVVRFDNRDAGLSTHLGESPAEPAYALSDLAGDAAGLVDELGLGSVHVVGASMGGMIAQLVAIEHPDRVRSLTSIMSTTGDPTVGEASQAAIAALTAPPALTREAVLDGAVVANRIMGSPDHPMAADEVRARAGRAFDRAYDPVGFGRQLQACLTTPDRTEALCRLDLPTLVIHGAADTLIGVSGGRATAAAVPGAELLVLDGVGHEVPEGVWPLVVDRIAALVARAEERSTVGRASG
ncbi:alpha/beta hydrolase [Microlunatus aurantiacus]|uniref:Alpha/beta hydrolase n=1 Tax=Microlunatus aurantiacus TaxID=446786 RepID=A0ABP7CZ50_9ACTN